MKFPESREARVEDSYVRYWSSNGDLEGLLFAIDEAVRQRRPQLAIRLLGLVPEEDVRLLNGEVEALRRRMQFFLVDSRVQSIDEWDAVTEISGSLRDEIMGRARMRARRSLRPEAGDLLGLTRGSPRRRRR